MRPAATTEPSPRRRKRSLLDQVTPFAEPKTSAPTTFFLARGSNIDSTTENEATSSQIDSSDLKACPNPQETMSKADSSQIQTNENLHTNNSVNRIKNVSPIRSPSISSQADVAQSQPLTPLTFGSPGEGSISSSPKSVSTRPIPKAEEPTDETGSQAVVSSGEEDELPHNIRDSAPQLIMPSIKMPSRRPFTTRGKEIGRVKIMVAGGKGVGKTSLIKSVVQVCEDIVHVDPIQPSTASANTKTGRSKSSDTLISEIFASTKPYPSWWSDNENSYSPQRRKSVGDSVLERNVCFVDVTCQDSETIVSYMEQQLYRSSLSAHASRNDLVGLLSGMGGSQVDMVLYLITADTIQTGLEQIKQLSELCNVIPIIAKSDLLTTERIDELKTDLSTSLASKLVTLPSLPNSEAEKLYAVSSTNSPDTETMDASLLMSSEYVQPLVPSELSLLVERIFDKENTAYLRHSAAKLLLSWKASHPTTLPPSPSLPRPSTLISPLPSSPSTSGVLVPYGGNPTLNTSNSYSLAKLADHTQREEQLAHIRLAEWASDLQKSLQRERERYESLAQGERAIWLVDRMGEEFKHGKLVPVGQSHGNANFPNQFYNFTGRGTAHDPLGLLHWTDTLQTRSWLAFQIVGSLGVVSGLTLWLAKINGFGPWS